MPAETTPTDGTTSLTLAEASRLLGRWIWIEERLFEVVGSWSEPGMTAATRTTLSEVSRRHAWRAEQLRARLPEVPGFAASDVVVPDPELTESLDTPSLAVVAEVVLPALEAGYVAHLERCSPVSDASVARTLGIVLADLRADQISLRTVL